MVTRPMVDGQYTDFISFLENVELVVLMVGHSHIRRNEKSLEGKWIFDTRNILKNVPTYRL